VHHVTSLSRQLYCLVVDGGYWWRFIPKHILTVIDDKQQDEVGL
jgi:hypothetical protein